MNEDVQGSGGVWAPTGKECLSVEAQPFMGERSMGEIQVYLNPRQGRPGSVKSSILAFLRVKILQVGTTWYPLGLHTKAFPDAQRLWKGTESRDQAQG